MCSVEHLHCIINHFRHQLFANIYRLKIEFGMSLNHFDNIIDLIPADDILKERLRVIEIDKYRKDHSLRLIMNEEHSTAIGYLSAN